MGSSSFVVGLMNALFALKNKSLSKNSLAKQSIYFEQKLLKETVDRKIKSQPHLGFPVNKILKWEI